MAATIKIKIKAKEKKGVVKAKLLIKHPMESGMRKDKDGNLIPIHHLTEVKVDYKGDTIFQGEFGTGVSKDPFVAFVFAGTEGETLTVTALDSKGISGKKESVIKGSKK